MDFVVLLSVLPFSDGLDLSKEVGVSIVFVLFVSECFTPDLSGIFKLTTRLKSTVSERLSTISVSQKLDTPIKRSAVNRKVFPFYPYYC